MRLLRLILILTILLVAYSTVLAVIMVPWSGAALGIVAMAMLARKGVQYTAHGTARWADASDIPHMLEGGD